MIKIGQDAPTTKKASLVIGRNKANRIKSYHRTGEPSPIYQFTNSEIVAGGIELFDFHNDEPKTKKYGAFTNIRVSNTSTKNILLYLGKSKNRPLFIASSSSIVLDRSALGGGVTSVSVENLNTTSSISEKEIRIEIWKEGVTPDSVIKTASKMIHDAFTISRGY